MKELLRSIKTVTPEYKINLTWSTIKVCDVLGPKTKMPLKELHKIGVVYEFTCDCNEKYVGESKRRLIDRISEHNRPSCKTAIGTHIQNCFVFSEKFNSVKNAALPTNERTSGRVSKIRLDYILPKFKTLATNLTNYNRRTDHEGMIITLNKPSLNEQITHKKILII